MARTTAARKALMLAWQELLKQAAEAPPNNATYIDVLELNVALESLESMRRANLEVEFSTAAPSFPVHHDRCTYC